MQRAAPAPCHSNTSRQGYSAATGLPVLIHHHLCRSSGPTTTGLGALRLTDPAQVLVPVRWGQSREYSLRRLIRLQRLEKLHRDAVCSSLIASPLAD